MIRNIVIEREYGSGAGGIAKKLADRLGWKLWDHAITEEIARRLRCDVKAVQEHEERCDSALYRLMKAFMRGSYEDRMVGGGHVELLDSDRLAEIFEQIALDIAKQGNAVIVGRGATWFLRDREDTFTVFIFAPREEKLRRLQASHKTLAEAEELIERVDQERAAFIKHYYGRNWPQRDLYHLMINSKVGDDLVVQTILTEIDLLNQREKMRSGVA